MGLRNCISKVYILIYLVNQNVHAGSAQAVTLPFQSVSVSSKTSPSSGPCTANTFTFSPASLPPVQTQGQQNFGQNYQALGQTSGASGPSCQNLAQTSVAQKLGQNLQQSLGQLSLTQNVGQNQHQSLGQPCGQLANSQGQYYQILNQPLVPSSGVSQNVNPFISSQNIVFSPNQNQNTGSNNVVASPSASSCSSPSQSTGLNIVSGTSSPQGSSSFNLVSSGPPNVNIVSSGLNVLSPQTSGLNYGPLNLMTVNSNYVPSQSSSNTLYPTNIVSGNTGYTGGQTAESLPLTNSYNNAILPSSIPVPNTGFTPQLSLNIQPSSQTCSCNNQPAPNPVPSPQNSMNVQPSSQSSTQPKFTLTNLRPLNLNSGTGSNINWKSISFQPNSISPLQIPSTLPSANPCNSPQSNQCSLNLGISPSLLQDINNVPPPSYNANAPSCTQNNPQVSVSPALNFQPLSGSCNQQLSSPSNSFIPTPNNINIISQQSANSVSSCSTPVANPSVNFGQLMLQNPVNLGTSSSCSSLMGQAPLQSQNVNSGMSCNSQVLPAQNVQNSLSGTSLNLALDQQMLNQLFSSIVSNTPSAQSSSCSSQVNAPQLNSYVQSSLPNIPTIYNNNAYSNVGSSQVSNCGSSQNFGSTLQNQPNSQVSNNIYNLYNQQSSNPYSTVGSQAPCSEYSNTLSSLPSVYTSNLASPTNPQVPSLTPASILSAYYSNSASTPINFESILSALSSPSITTEEIASLVSSLAESVLQQCNSLTSSSSSYPQSNLNALPISVSTSPVESSYTLPTYSSQYIPQQQSASYCNTPSVEIIENPTVSTCSGTQAGIPIKVTISDAPLSSDSGSSAYSSGQSQSLYSSNVQPYYSVEPSVYPSSVVGSVGKTSSSNMGIKDFVKILLLSELFAGGGYGGGSGGFGGNGLDGGLLALLLATAT